MKAITVRMAAAKVAKPRPIIAIFLRSNMSATAPAGRETRKTGIMMAVWTSATMLGEFDRRVISHAAPTPRINCPKFAKTLAIHRRRKTGSRKGANAPEPLLAETEPVSAVVLVRASIGPPFCPPAGMRQGNDAQTG